MASCIYFHLTGACPRGGECPYQHYKYDSENEDKWKILILPRFYTLVNSVRALRKTVMPFLCDNPVHPPPVEIGALFESIFPMMRFYGPIKRMAVSTNQKRHLGGNLYVEYHELADAGCAEDDLVDLKLFNFDGICNDLFPNLNLKTCEELSGQILEFEDNTEAEAVEFVCGSVKVYRTSMTFIHGVCRRECVPANCLLLHLVTTTIEQMLGYERSYQHYSDEEMSKFEETLQKMEFGEAVKIREIAEQFEGIEEVLNWTWEYRFLL